MAMNKKSFPRGGQKFSDASADLFGAVQRKAKPKNNKKISANLLQTEDVNTIETASTKLLDYSNIQDGMVLMGKVRAVDQLYLSIGLPARMVARVDALEISDAYTKAINGFLEKLDQAETYKPLSELYSVGQIVYGRVLELKKQGQEHRINISLSLKPSEVHAELMHTHIKKGFVFNGAIEEIQEHGYIIESGIRGLRCFLPFPKKQQSALHTVGKLVYMRIENIVHDKTASTCVCKEITAKSLKVKCQEDPHLDYILPSTIVDFNISKILKDGLQGTIMGGKFTAYINEHHFNHPFMVPEDFTINASLNARVLYTMPLTKFVCLTLVLDTTTPVESNSYLHTATPKKGDIIDDAIVHHVGSGGVILILKSKFKGLITFKTIKANYTGNYDQDEILIKYAKKTKHKIRILNYDFIDSLYICTDDAKILTEKVFSLSDLQVGEFVTAIVESRFEKVGGYFVKVGKVKGIIEKLFCAPSNTFLAEESQIRCRVLAANFERGIVYLTNHPEYLSASSKVLICLQDAKKNHIYTGTVVKCHEDYYLVKFFNNIKGVLHKSNGPGYMANELSTMYEGQTTQFRITSVKGEQITLGLPEYKYTCGEICLVSVTHVLESGLEIKINDKENSIATKGLIPVRLLSDFDDFLYAKLRLFQSGIQTSAVSIVKNIFSLRDVDYFKDNLKDWRTVQPGDILRAFVQNVEGDVVHIMVLMRGYEKLVKVHLNMLLMSSSTTFSVVLNQEQVIYVRVLSKEHITKTLTISAKLIDVWDCKLTSTAKYIEKYLRELEEIKITYKKQGNPIADLTIGDKIIAKFQGVRSDTKDWQFEIVESKINLVVKASIISKSRPPEIGEKQECCVLWIDYSNQEVFGTNKSCDIQRITTSGEVPPNLYRKSGTNAKVLLKVSNLFICSLKKGQNPLIYCPTRLHYNDFEESCSVGVEEGDFCKLTFIHDFRPIAVLESTWKLWQIHDNKRKLVEDIATKQKRSKLDEQVSCKIAVGENVINASFNKKTSTNGSVREDLKKIRIKEVDKVSTATVDKQSISKCESTALPGISDFWLTDLSDVIASAKNAVVSSDEGDDTSVKQHPRRAKKCSVAEEIKKTREEEARLREIEDNYVNPKQIPESVDQFDRLVLSEPHNSKHWIQYMVFHLQLAEIDKARSVARRAIKAIPFRYTDEQLNIWIALLNLELRYGTKQSYTEVFKEALNCNDTKKIYFSTIEVLSNAKRKEELIEIISAVTRNFKQDPDSWRVAAKAYFSIGMIERAQQLLQRALLCLPQRYHVNTIVMFANMNHQYGNNEVAQVLFDQVVTSYPKRVDVWTQYVDLLIKSKCIESARCVLERAVLQKIPLKKMRIIFKKYLEFEERFGQDADVQNVKRLAAEYVKRNANL